ncbi:DUF1801 domain-containing protein [Cesiribacter andamanensis]|uniref:YdhG-like domain-containing protein n=1 Tax=Cesiribacter andamanensis AMV16 TaxID=1279009 RepID=M7N312_9BACT|nr:DUF1801 domain-containing protein [Cesiribacter andamanensis]EMR03073.1 hypothetical protein ADICEAN_01802 [Cesiribacter andamanensis AMV16]
MHLTALSPAEYISSLPADRQAPMQQLRSTLQQHLPPGFEECINYGMIAYVVPHSRYPAGYHCDPKLPLPFISIASQKNFIALYHMGLYADPQLLSWFTATYPLHSNHKLDMGKSCIRFKKPDRIPYALIGELAEKLHPQQWIALYEKELKRKPLPNR